MKPHAFIKMEKAPQAIAAIAWLLVFSACGSQPYTSENQAPAAKGFTLPASQDFSVPSDSGSSDSTVTTPAVSGKLPPIVQRVGGVGYNQAVSLQVRVRRILKIKFTPGVQDQNATGTGYMPAYSALGVYISVESTSLPTPLLKNSYQGQTAETSGVMDFSGAFARVCANTDTACRQDVVITVNKPNYDYWCLKFAMYCPWSHVWDTHPWNGTLTIQTDDTNSI